MIQSYETVLTDFRESIDAIEEAYEFMLAYAAQGRIDEDSASSPNIRELAEKAKAALEKFSQKMGLKDAECPNADEFFDNMVSFPFHQWMSEDDFYYLLASTREVLEEMRS